jgi:hypothetical protein
MRTPAQRQQNYALESIITEAAVPPRRSDRLPHAVYQQRRLHRDHEGGVRGCGWNRALSWSRARRTGSTPIKGRGGDDPSQQCTVGGDR